MRNLLQWYASNLISSFSQCQHGVQFQEYQDDYTQTAATSHRQLEKKCIRLISRTDIAFGIQKVLPYILFHFVDFGAEGRLTPKQDQLHNNF